MSQAPDVDVARLMAEIEEEAAQRRRSGDLPRDFERDLDRTFAHFAPVDAVDADFDTLLAEIEQAAVIDTRPSTMSALIGVARAKQGVAKATGFYFRHLASQVSSLFQATMRALRVLGERVEDLEKHAPLRQSDVWRRLERIQDPRAALARRDWEDLAVDVLGGVTGRVLHAEAGNGELVARLVEAGVDAYGVEPIDDAALVASDRAPDIRADEAVDHLRLLPPGSLAGVVLSGCTDRMAVESLVDLADLAASRLVPGGVLVVISTHPSAWAQAASPVTVDLARGHPLHPETWQVLLGACRLSSIEVHQRGSEPGPATFAVTAVCTA